jgi:hypothetical protein
MKPALKIIISILAITLFMGIGEYIYLTNKGLSLSNVLDAGEVEEGR